MNIWRFLHAALEDAATKSVFVHFDKRKKQRGGQGGLAHPHAGRLAGDVVGDGERLEGAGPPEPHQ
eukprot:980778-Prorocentrum_minimum.AAC.1